MKDNINQVVEKVNQLFITTRYKYIKLNEDGNYYTFNKYNNENHDSLHNGFITSHILRKSTYGIFCRKTHTKFVTFDVDVPDIPEAKKVVLALHESLNTIGIPSDKIFTSWSGTKGYHVDVYFSEEIPYNLMRVLFNAAVSEAYNLLDGKINGKIELRPTPTQGLKLPLSINYKNKDKSNNICWYVDVQNNFTNIQSFDYFLGIEPMNADIVKSLILDLQEDDENLPDTDSEGRKLENSAFGNIDLSEDTLDSLEDLYKNGLRKPGTRNAVTCKLAVYFNTLNENKYECEQKLRDWMRRQNKVFFKTPIEECFEEITRIVNLVYKKNVVLSKGLSEIIISRSELLTLCQYPKKFQKTLTALFIHSKRFADRNNEFFMTYEQIALAANCSIKTAINHIKLLEQESIIRVTRSPIYVRGNKLESHPNIYELNLNWLNVDKEVSISVMADNVKSYRNMRIQLILKLFPNNEWWNISELLNIALEKQSKE
ncbi:TOTE conflict system archaeo-eukaryotic primase domain-containing protein [Bacillus sp. UMB0728]|uniref:TOTE conflict system archaeo-eukaryotic primase domain-containing protein n=1 Tax=Bacillus sp. UMB0728 TaxID=2066052 RepID=UPI000C767588|nr:hypothetical protein [Bacillus sp. UMB0728]PLR70282.1 hypothetical protein CYJ37_25000 [Bacillus sp. UMB0728]